MKHGGPAFPTESEHQASLHTMHYEGMTLRDYFAAKVIQGMSARDMYDNGQRSPTDRARLAYLEADAMLAERSK